MSEKKITRKNYWRNPGIIPSEISRGISEKKIPGRVLPAGTSARITDRIPLGFCEYISTGIFERIPGEIPEGMSVGIFQRFFSGFSEAIPAEISEGIP